MTLFGVEKLKQSINSLILSMASVVWGNSWFRLSVWSKVQIRCHSLFHEVPIRFTKNVLVDAKTVTKITWILNSKFYECHVVKQYLFSIFTIISKLITD